MLFALVDNLSVQMEVHAVNFLLDNMAAVLCLMQSVVVTMCIAAPMDTHVTLCKVGVHYVENLFYGNWFEPWGISYLFSLIIWTDFSTT